MTLCPPRDRIPTLTASRAQNGLKLWRRRPSLRHERHSSINTGKHMSLHHLLRVILKTRTFLFRVRIHGNIFSKPLFFANRGSNPVLPFPNLFHPVVPHVLRNRLTRATNSAANRVNSFQFFSRHIWGESRLEPTPRATQPAARNSGAFCRVTPLVAMIFKCGNGARMDLMKAGLSAGNIFTKSAPAS